MKRALQLSETARRALGLSFLSELVLTGGNSKMCVMHKKQVPPFELQVVLSCKEPHRPYLTVLLV